jgi:eukaryotic-like serine/threonine-protein kinase
MTPDRWKQIEHIFFKAVELPQDKRPAFLLAECGQDSELFHEVESLLQQEDQTGAMLKTIISHAADSFSQQEPGNLKGKRFGAYLLTELVGQGGMAEVYKAVRDDDQYQKQVAIKLIHHNKFSFLISRFWHERQILANLEHSNIARFLEGGTSSDGIPYLVMEFIEGEPITTYCDKNNLTIRQRLDLFRIVCNAVQYAHRNLVIHRDLKPSNILVTTDGVPKLLDFGIAKLLNPDLITESPTATVTSLRMMTPEYASPEQVLGQQVTTATDVYSLGAVLYELLTKERAHQLNTHSFAEIENVICKKDPELPSLAVKRIQSSDSEEKVNAKKRLSREFVHELDNIVLKAMEKDPQRRYNTAAQFGEDVARYLDGLPILARTSTLSYRAAKFVRRHRTAVAISIIVVLLLAGFAVAMTIQAARIASERDRANQVTNFLVKLFEVSNPSESKGNSVTARELLDASSQKIQTDLRNQPEVQAALMETMGRVYGNLGLYKTAIPLLEKSLQTRKEKFGEDNLDVAATMNDLAEALFYAGKYKEGEPLARKALATRRKFLGNQHQDVAMSLSNLGGEQYVTGQYAEAESMFREALSIRQKLFGDENLLVATSLSQLGLALKMQEKDDEAEVLYRKSLAIRRKFLGNNHPDIATSLNNLGRLLLDKPDYDGAEQMLREAVELDRKILGKDHPDLAITITGLGQAMRGKKNYTEAEKLFRESLELRERVLPKDHPSIAISMNNLAGLLIDEKKFDEADELAHQAQQIFKKALPAKHINHASVLLNLGRSQVGQKNFKEAEELLNQSLSIYLANFTADNLKVANVKRILGECLIQEGHFKEAESLLLEANRNYEEKHKFNHPDAIDTRQSLVSLYTAWGKPTEALRYH